MPLLSLLLLLMRLVVAVSGRIRGKLTKEGIGEGAERGTATVLLGKLDSVINDSVEGGSCAVPIVEEEEGRESRRCYAILRSCILP